MGAGAVTLSSVGTMDVLVAFPVFVLLKMLDSSLLSSRAALAAAAPAALEALEPCSGEKKRAG